MNTKIGGDLLDGHTVIAVTGDADDIIAELTGVGPGHTDILPAHPSRASQLRCHLIVQQTLARVPLAVLRICRRVLCRVTALTEFVLSSRVPVSHAAVRGLTHATRRLAGRSAPVEGHGGTGGERTFERQEKDRGGLL